jgi:hypothetical protein
MMNNADIDYRVITLEHYSNLDYIPILISVGKSIQDAAGVPPEERAKGFPQRGVCDLPLGKV